MIGVERSHAADSIIQGTRGLLRTPSRHGALWEYLVPRTTILCLTRWSRGGENKREKKRRKMPEVNYEGSGSVSNFH